MSTRSPRAASNWSRIALEARQAISDSAATGEDGLARLASERRLHVQTCRRYVAALAFVDGVSDQLPRELLACPLDCVEIVARWFRHDPKGAAKATADLVDGRHTVRSLRTKEIGRGRTRHASFRARTEAFLRREMPSIALDPGWPASELEPDVDIRFVASGVRGFGNGAVLLLGPYVPERVRVAKAGNRLLKALGLTLLSYEVIVAVGDQDLHRTCQRWLRHNRVDNDVINVVLVED